MAGGFSWSFISHIIGLPKIKMPKADQHVQWCLNLHNIKHGPEVVNFLLLQWPLSKKIIIHSDPYIYNEGGDTPKCLASCLPMPILFMLWTGL